jgi:uncharacterized membrane protein
MNLPDALLSPLWSWSGWLLFTAVVGVALVRAPWYHLRDSRAVNAWLAACVAVMLLWSLNGGIAAGLGFHLLGVTVLTLMFGWQFAILSIVLVLIGETLNGDAGWSAFGWNALSMGVVPVLVTTGLLRVSVRFLPANFFVYIFFVAFLGGILSMGLVGLTTSLVLVWSGAYSWQVLSGSYLPVFLLLLFPEGFLSGMLMSIIVVYRPEWVSTFDDDYYLRGK